MDGILRRLRGLRRVAGRRDRQSGVVEAGVAATGLSLVLGAALGSGVASTMVTMADGTTWVPDDAVGQVVQVNPVTGQVERRLQVAGTGSSLGIVQRDGRLVVDDEATGVVTAIDLATLLASGQRVEPGETRVLVGGGRVFIATLSGTVRAVDPLTLRDLGTPLRTGALADAVVDDEGTVWLVTQDGRLLEATWAGRAFTVDRERELAGTGPRTRLVAHGRGATVFGADGGVVAQVGTSRELALAAGDLPGDVLPAQTAPHDLAPAALPQAGRVLLLSRGDLLDVAVGSLGCTRPGRPAVVGDLVYVPCTGTGRVVVLDRDGRRGGPDVHVPGGGQDPRLTVDDGRLLVHSEVPDAVVVVEPDGSTRQVVTGGGDGPVRDVNAPGPVVTPPPAAPPATDPPTGADAPPPPDDGSPTGPTPPPTGPAPPVTHPDLPPTVPPTVPPTLPPSVPPTAPPAGPGDPDDPDDPGDPGGPTTPPTTPEPPGTTPPPTVPPTTPPPTTAPPPTAPPPTAPPVTPTPTPTSQPPTTPPPAAPRATAATGVAAVVAADGRVTVSWSGASSGADAYVVSPEGGAGTQVAGTARSVVLADVPPGTTTRFVVETRLGSSTAVSAPSNAVTVPGVPGAPSSVSATLSGRSGSVLTVAVSIGASADNGSAVVSRTVRWSGGGVSGATTTGGTSVTLSIDCAGRALCTSGGTLQVTATATNGVGEGSATSTGVAVPAPPPPPPAAGDVVVTSVSWSAPGQWDLEIPVYAHLAPPASWRAHTGTCELHVAGGITSVRAIACTTSGQVLLGGARGGSSVTAVVRAVVDGRAVDSAAVTEDVPPRNTWAYCDPDTRVCTQPVSLPDPGEIEVVPAPWTPVPGQPGGPEPAPVLAAGLGLIGLAGVARALRTSRTRTRARTRRAEEDR